jgi:hypothetical protein
VLLSIISTIQDICGPSLSKFGKLELVGVRHLAMCVKRSTETQPACLVYNQSFSSVSYKRICKVWDEKNNVLVVKTLNSSQTFI